MTTLVRIAIAIALALFLSSCGFGINIGDFGNGKKGSGTIVEDIRNVTADFTEVHASEGIEVYVTQEENFGILVEADDNIIDLIGTEIKNGKLKIHAEENIGNATKKVYVSLPIVSSLQSSSGARLTGQNQISTTSLRMAASSGARLNAAVNTPKLELDASSGAHIEVAGNAGEVYADSSSGANVSAKDLKSKTCKAQASSGANISIYVSDALDASASSGANISYDGDAAVTENKSVSGNVRRY